MNNEELLKQANDDTALRDIEEGEWEDCLALHYHYKQING